MTSFAKSLSPTPIRADSPRPDFDQSRQANLEKARASEMVTKDAPRPVLKPSPALSYGPDGTAFNTAWQDEAKAARRAAFIKTRNDPATGGQVRTLNKSFNR